VTATRKPPKSWRVCPKCRGRATKLYHLNSGKYQCQQCRHEYDPPNGQKPAAIADLMEQMEDAADAS
jgi:rubredoxin